MKLNGIYTPLITPFKKTYEIDRDALAQVIEYQIAAGISGLIVSGTTGESYALTVEERTGLFGFVAEVIAHRVPMLGGIGAARTEEMIELGRAAKRAGASAVLMPAPYYSVPSEKELAQHAIVVDKSVGLPIVLYNYPARTGTNMGTEFLDRVAARPNFCAIKETSGDVNRLHLLACDYPELQLSCGMDDQALEFFAWGAQSWIAGGANCLPEEHIALHRACVVERDFDKGRRIMTAMMPLMRVLEQGGEFIPCVKFACAWRGLPAGHVRRPLLPLDAALRRKMTSTLESLVDEVAKIVGHRASGSEAVVPIRSQTTTARRR